MTAPIPTIHARKILPSFAKIIQQMTATETPIAKRALTIIHKTTADIFNQSKAYMPRQLFHKLCKFLVVS